MVVYLGEMMTMLFNVPTIACETCAKTITKAIQNQESGAQVKVDVENKTVVVTTAASEALIKEAIEKAGHTVEI